MYSYKIRVRLQLLELSLDNEKLENAKILLDQILDYQFYNMESHNTKNLSIIKELKDRYDALYKKQLIYKAHSLYFKAADLIRNYNLSDAQQAIFIYTNFILDNNLNIDRLIRAKSKLEKKFNKRIIKEQIQYCTFSRY